MYDRMQHLGLALLATLLALTTASGVHAKAYLVAVGIADYPGSDKDLTLPVNDAETVAWIYQKNGGSATRLLTNYQAGTQAVTQAMEQLYAKAEKDDIVVFFFSGHGYPGGFVTYDGRLGYEQVRKCMARGRCKNKIIFADACFSGKMATPQRDSQNSIAAAQKASVMLFLSSRSNETSIERRDMKNGFFTTFLQKGLKGAADKNKDRIITARELYKYVHDGVTRLSKGKQHPMMWGKFPDNMPVMQW